MKNNRFYTLFLTFAQNYTSMRLIIDAGSTKMEWVVLDDGRIVDRFTTRGYNPNYNDSVVFIDILYKELREDFPVVDAVYYYGTGCGSDTNRENVAQFLRVRFEEAKEVVVTHDLMAACHAVLGREKGIACILGTGSNSCVYDGESITEQAVSLGYLLGDEGSGYHIGKEITRAYFYGFMPDELRHEFDQTYHLELKDFIGNAYHHPTPSKYLAAFAKFAGENQNNPFVRDLVKNCFRAFIEAFVLRFDDCKSLQISFVGSVAYHFRDLLRETLADRGLTMGEVMQSPSKGLIRYYGGCFV